VDAAGDLALEQSGGLQHTQMLGDGGERNIEGRGELGDGGLALRQARENGAAGGIGQGPEGGVERGVAGGGGIVNHMV
jgi:hypothetical protein